MLSIRERNAERVVIGRQELTNAPVIQVIEKQDLLHGRFRRHRATRLLEIHDLTGSDRTKRRAPCLGPARLDRLLASEYFSQ